MHDRVMEVKEKWDELVRPKQAEEDQGPSPED